MGLLQQACETYDAFAQYAGVLEEGKVPLVPITHMPVNTNIEITIDKNGNFIAARAVDKKEPKIIIPVTEASAGRTVAPCAHPLCDYLAYVAPGDKTKHDLYVNQLTDWANAEPRHPKLTAILAYVKRGGILDDLQKAELVELDGDGRPQNDKLFVRWVVNGLGAEHSGACWEDPSLFESFIRYYTGRSGVTRGLCMISGDEEELAEQHPKGIIPVYGNAKLISANDTSNFTFRGRFCEARQAATVGYAASQKAHNALRWIAANQGVRVSMPGDAPSADDGRSFNTFGGRTFLCWNPHGLALPQPAGVLRPKKAPAGGAAPMQSYRQRLKDALDGWRTELPAYEGVVIAAFDAATTGRLSLTYYNELLASDFLERLYHWDNTCCWYNGSYGVQSPTLYQIANFAFGTPRDGRFANEDRVLRQQMQRLIACRVDKHRFPCDIERRLVQRASNPLVLDGELRERLLFTTCAVIQKYYTDRNETRWTMEMGLNTNDRSFQFGRLLAVLERAEEYYYWRTGENAASDGDDEPEGRGRTERQTNVERLWSLYRQRPLNTFEVIHRKLETAYLPRIRPAQKGQYLKLSGEITEQLLAMGMDRDALNKPLSDQYLLGYFLQRQSMRSKNKTGSAEEE